MSFARLHKLISYLIAALGLVSLSIGPELELPSEIAIFLGFGASWLVEGPILRDVRWARGWTIGLIALLVVEVARGFLGAPLLPLVLEFAAALQISRLFNRRGAAEHQQIAALALLHLIAATVLSTELSYAFAFLGFVVVAPWMLALGHLRAEIEGQQLARPEAERDSATERLLASKRLVGPGFLFRIGALAVPLFAMTGLVFVAFPRVGLGFLSFGRDTGQRVSGFGADVELGDFGVIRTDPTVVLRVRPPDLGEDPSPTASIRMRGTSFDAYDGRRWTRSRELGAEGVGRIDSYFAIPYRMPDPLHDRRWEIVLDALEEPVIFLPPSTVGLEIPPRVTGGIELGREITVAPGIDVRYADADGLGLRYAAWTSEDRADHAAVPLDPDMLRRYLQVPAGHERVALLAREWTRHATTDEQRVLAILGHLRESGEFEYSLEMPRVGDRVPLDVFLFEARRGHCEYYSTAMAVMLRTLGIPTRNVTGFLGGTYNSYGGYYSLSQGDAHSWLEAWLPDVGWVPLDPTPPGREDVGMEGGWLRTLRDIADAVKTRWAEDVVGYDLRSQIAIFGAIRRWIGSEGQGEESVGAHREGARGGSSVPGWLWVVILALAALVAGAIVAWRRRRPKAARLDPAVEGAVRLYRGLDAALAKLGFARPPDRTPVEHVAVIEQLGFGEVDLVREVTRAYLAARYGAQPIPDPDLERLENAVRALRGRRDLSRAPS